jgi:hypothetical protein
MSDFEQRVRDALADPKNQGAMPAAPVPTLAATLAANRQPGRLRIVPVDEGTGQLPQAAASHKRWLATAGAGR